MLSAITPDNRAMPLLGLAGCCSTVEAVTVRNLTVWPSSVVAAGEQDVVLDCDFDLDDDERLGLEVKWYFRMQDRSFVQWIPGGDRKPQVREKNTQSKLD